MRKGKIKMNKKKKREMGEDVDRKKNKKRNKKKGTRDKEVNRREEKKKWQIGGGENGMKNIK